MIIAYFFVWNAQYLWEYLPKPLDIGVVFLLIMTAGFLLIIGIYQLFKYLTEKPKINFRLINFGLIMMILMLSYLKPSGLIDFKKFEGENILFASAKGVANCRTMIKLKAENRFKKTVICFGIDHSWGNFEIVNDTIKFYYDGLPKNDKTNDFAILKLENDTIKKRLGAIFYHSNKLRNDGIPMLIKELKKEELK